MYLKYLLVLSNFFIWILLNLIFSPLILNDSIRIFSHKINSFFWSNTVYYFLKDKVIFINSAKLPCEKINIINSNHCYQIDLFILNYIFYHNNIEFYKVSSISTDINISFIDKAILKSINACMINYKNFKEPIKNSINNWYNSNYNRYIINFFEGKAKCDYKEKLDKNIMNPKKLGFLNIMNNYPKEIQYITDVNIIYSLNNRVLNIKNSEIIHLIFRENVKIYIEINRYNLPKNDYSNWLENLYEKKDNQIENIKNKYNLK